MARHRHWYRRLAGDALPRRLVALATDTEPEEVEGRPGVYRDRLVSWRAVAWIAEGAAVLREFAGAGTDGPSWWDRLDKFACTGVLTWVFGWSLKRSVSSLGFWLALEEKRYTLSAVDCPQDDSSLPRSTSRRPTVCCLAESPFLLDLRCVASGALVRLTDLENWGVAPPANCESAIDRVRCTASAVRVLVSLIALRNWGPLKPTAGSLAVSLWRRKHLAQPPLAHTVSPILFLERTTYHGGRCECYRLGKIDGPVYHLDIVSCYGAIARDADLPIALAEWECDPKGGILLAKRPLSNCLADVTVETSEPAYPCSVYLSPNERPKLWEYWRSCSPPRPPPQCIWPVGRFRTCLSGPELTDAFVHGRISRVWKVAEYLSAPTLSAVATDLLEVLQQARRDRDVIKGTLVKSLIVSLVGKFGETSWRWEDADGIAPIAPWAEWWYTPHDSDPVHCRSLAWHVQRQVRQDYGDNAVYSIASWITSAARMRLLEFIRTAHWEEVYYVDTDCLFTTQVGRDRLLAARYLRDGEPGFLVTKEIATSVNLLGIKHYATPTRSVCAGYVPGVTVPAAGLGLASVAESPDSALRSGRPPEGLRQTVDVSHGGTYVHGVVGADSVVRPWRFK